jgi:hypothetical protein
VTESLSKDTGRVTTETPCPAAGIMCETGLKTQTMPKVFTTKVNLVLGLASLFIAILSLYISHNAYVLSKEVREDNIKISGINLEPNIRVDISNSVIEGKDFNIATFLNDGSADALFLMGILEYSEFNIAQNKIIDSDLKESFSFEKLNIGQGDGIVFEKFVKATEDTIKEGNIPMIKVFVFYKDEPDKDQQTRFYWFTYKDDKWSFDNKNVIELTESPE